MDVAAVLNRFGIPWPGVDSGKARQAANAWTAIANAANIVLDHNSTMISELTEVNSGPTMTAFIQYRSQIGSAPDECTAADAKGHAPGAHPIG